MRISSSRASFSSPRLSLGLELVGGGVCAFSHFQGFAKLPSSMVTPQSELGMGSFCSTPPLVQSHL